MGKTMSIAFSAPATEDTYLFEEIEDGEVYWISADPRNPYHCLAEFERLNPDGISRDFNCLNGSWTGTLTDWTTSRSWSRGLGIRSPRAAMPRRSS